jgi:uncharacterized tellurite resistance protein B-like protein
MFDSFVKFVTDLTAGDKHPGHFEDNDYRLAAAALLVHAAAIDGDIGRPAQEKLHTLIKQRFELDDAATDELLDEATEAEHDAVDLYHFTSLLNRSMDDAGRRRLVEMMWEIVFVDGGVSEFEDNLLWRAADLLGVSSRERIELRHRVAEMRAQSDAGAKSGDGT